MSRSSKQNIVDYMKRIDVSNKDKKNCPSQFHPASQSANSVPVSADAGDDVREGSRSRIDGADPRVRLYNASGLHRVNINFSI